MEHTPVDPSLVMPMHFEGGNVQMEIPRVIPTVEYVHPTRVVEAIGPIALDGSETLATPVPIAFLAEVFRRADALRQAS